MLLCCKYHSVGYFVFARPSLDEAWDAILEVSDEREGAEFVDWLSRFPFGIHQFRTVANDNSPLNVGIGGDTGNHRHDA